MNAIHIFAVYMIGWLIGRITGFSELREVKKKAKTLEDFIRHFEKGGE